MAPRTEKNGPKAAGFGLLLIIGLAAILGVQGAIYRSVIDRTIGSSSAYERSGAIAGELQVSLLRSAASAKAGGGNPAFYYDLPLQWEIVLKEAGIRYHVITDADLAKGTGVGNGVLLLPSAACLSEPQRRAIRDHLAKGGGLVASGGLGARNADCSWRGWDFLTAITGLESPYPVAPAEQPRVSFRGELFFSQAVPAGYHLGLLRQEIIAGSAPSPDAFWSDARLRPAGDKPVTDVATAVHGKRGAGRFAWFGFQETMHGGADRKMLNHYLATVVRWVGRQPLAVMGNWPNGSRAAVLIAEEIQPGDGAAGVGVELLRREKVPATFFFNSPAKPHVQALLKNLKAAGEIASGGDSGDAFADQNLARQTDRLVRSRQALEQMTLRRVAGFYPPQGLWNESTVAALHTAGYAYYIDQTSVTRAVPELMPRAHAGFLSMREPALARISRVASDDFEVIAGYTGPTPYADDLADGFMKDFRHVSYLRGVYTLAFRSDLLGAPENIHVLGSIVRRIKTQPAWFASGETLSDWWSRRDAVHVEARRINAHRIRVAATNRGPEDVENAGVFVYLPYRPNRIRTIRETLGRKAPQMTLIDQDDVLRIDFPRLKAQSSQVFLLALDEQ